MRRSLVGMACMLLEYSFKVKSGVSSCLAETVSRQWVPLPSRPPPLEGGEGRRVARRERSVARQEARIMVKDISNVEKLMLRRRTVFEVQRRQRSRD